MKHFIPFFLLFMVVGTYARSQSMQPCVINATGGSSENEYYSYEWSIGELALVNEMVATEGKYIITNGFLQPYIRKGNPAEAPAIFKDHEIRILTNPVKNMLGVQLISNDKGKLKLSVFDERGYIMYYDEINIMGAGATATINMMNYANGNYLLKADFTNDDKTKTKKARTYKIIKIH